MVQPILYIDSYAVLNLLIDYFLLLGTGRITHGLLKRGRIWAAAGLGSLYSLLALPGLLPFSASVAGGIASFPAGLAFGAVMIFIAYGKRFFLRRWVVFIILSAALSGIFQLSSGFLRLHLPALILLTALFALLLRRGFSGSAGRPTKQLRKTELTLAGHTAVFQALEDTGNHLRDPMTGRSVLVVEWESLKPLFSSEVRQLVSSRSFSQPECAFRLLSTLQPGRFFLLPFQTVGTQRGLFVAFRPDHVMMDGKEENGMTVAIAGRPLGTDVEYTALAGTV